MQELGLDFSDHLKLFQGLLWDFTEDLDKEISNGFTSSVPLLSTKVSGNVSNILHNLSVVSQDLRGNGRDELGWVCENFTPFLNSLNITLHILAVRQVTWQFRDDGTNITNSFDDICNILCFEFINNALDLISDLVSITKTLLDLAEIFLLDEIVDQSTDELFGKREFRLLINFEKTY